MTRTHRASRRAPARGVRAGWQRSTTQPPPEQKHQVQQAVQEAMDRRDNGGETGH